MRIGVPRETKDNESRVGLTPRGVAALRGRGHEVVVERGAGLGCGFADGDYSAAGATLGGAAEAWDRNLVIKVKEPLEPEYPRLRVLDGLVGDRGRTAREQRFGELQRGAGKVKVSEHDLAAQSRILGLERFLDLDHELAVPGLHCVAECRARRRVVGVREAAA